MCARARVCVTLCVCDTVCVCVTGTLRKAMRAECAQSNVSTGIVWRAMNGVAIESYTVGMKFLMQSFLSTSSSRTVAQRFGSTLFRIDLDGDGLTYALDVSRVSVYPDEQEVLVYPYSGFVVLATEKMDDGRNLISLRTCDTYLVESGTIPGTTKLGAWLEF